MQIKWLNVNVLARDLLGFVLQLLMAVVVGSDRWPHILSHWISELHKVADIQHTDRAKLQHHNACVLSSEAKGK